MGKISRVDDFVSQLVRIKVKTTRQHLISLREVDQRKQDLEELYLNSKWNRIRSMIDLKLAYMMMRVAFEKAYNIDEENDYDELVEKDELVKLVREMEKASSTELSAVEEEIRNNPRLMNEYKVLGVPTRSSMNIIDEQYYEKIKAFEKALDQRIENGYLDKNEIIEAKAMIDMFSNAYSNISNPEYKLRLDEILLFNFNPDRAYKYSQGSFSEITYMPERKYVRKSNGDMQEPSYLAKNSQGDEIIIIQTGDLGFGRFKKEGGDVTFRDPYKLKEYKIIKRYKDPYLSEMRKKQTQKANSLTEWDDAENGEVFNVYGNINIKLLTNPQVDKEYIRYNTDVLLSTTNLEEALRNNGGYFGEVYLDRDNREYIVYFDDDSLSLAKDFKTIKDKRISRGEPIKGVAFVEKVDLARTRRSVEGEEK